MEQVTTIMVSNGAKGNWKSGGKEDGSEGRDQRRAIS